MDGGYWTLSRLASYGLWLSYPGIRALLLANSMCSEFGLTVKRVLQSDWLLWFKHCLLIGCYTCRIPACETCVWLVSVCWSFPFPQHWHDHQVTCSKARLPLVRRSGAALWLAPRSHVTRLPFAGWRCEIIRWRWARGKPQDSARRIICRNSIVVWAARVLRALWRSSSGPASTVHARWSADQCNIGIYSADQSQGSIKLTSQSEHRCF